MGKHVEIYRNSSICMDKVDTCTWILKIENFAGLDVLRRMITSCGIF